MSPLRYGPEYYGIGYAFQVAGHMSHGNRVLNEKRIGKYICSH